MGTGYFPEGLTVRDLKRLVADWPETHRDGSPTLVFITHCPDSRKPWQRLSNQAHEVGEIDHREGIGDLYFGPVDRA